MLKYKGYSARVEFDSEAMVMFGEIEGLRDVVTFEGKSVEELDAAFRESVDDYLEWCEKRGESPDKPYSGRFLVRIDADTHRFAAISAAQKGLSLNAYIATLLQPDARSATAAHSGFPVGGEREASDFLIFTEPKSRQDPFPVGISIISQPRPVGALTTPVHADTPMLVKSPTQPAHYPH